MMKNVTAEQIREVMDAIKNNQTLTPEQERWFDQWMEHDSDLQYGL